VPCRVIGWGLAYLLACRDSVGVKGIGLGSIEALFWQGGGISRGNGIFVLLGHGKE